jgi:hypothetical protein
LEAKTDGQSKGVKFGKEDASKNQMKDESKDSITATETAKVTRGYRFPSSFVPGLE